MAVCLEQVAAYGIEHPEHPEKPAACDRLEEAATSLKKQASSACFDDFSVKEIAKTLSEIFPR